MDDVRVHLATLAFVIGVAAIILLPGTVFGAAGLIIAWSSRRWVRRQARMEINYRPRMRREVRNINEWLRR